ncbi:hypothetical protein VTJ04DRAFT_6508 [Mycothermus thermophilus]|uniref:uncharacterized protein n=1 Tax=Humicola insolens TaxID=85995 RepID=UPI003743CB86
MGSWGFNPVKSLCRYNFIMSHVIIQYKTCQLPNQVLSKKTDCLPKSSSSSPSSSHLVLITKRESRRVENKTNRKGKKQNKKT